MAPNVAMSRSAYHKVATLATHPAFTVAAGALRCPLCPAHPEVYTTTSTADFDRHFAGHSPTATQAERWLSGRSYERLALASRWVEPCPGAGTPAPTAQADPLGRILRLRPPKAACPICGRRCGQRNGILRQHAAATGSRGRSERNTTVGGPPADQVQP